MVSAKKRKREPSSSEEDEDDREAGSSKSKPSPTPRKRKAGERVQSKSPAEFFAEHQNIAGFDNPGKCLYTTIRELVENGLDAAESIGQLPSIAVTVVALSQQELQEISGLQARARVDLDLYRSPKAKKKKKDAKQEEGKAGDTAAGDVPTDVPPSQQQQQKGEMSFYRVTCKDNGIGMPHDAMPDMLGRVLSGSKYGVRQTRGKYGLGAKMALIWSKKSTGLPISVKSAHNPHGKEEAASMVSSLVLDINIQKNEPHVVSHKQEVNAEGWRGTEISLTIGGNWTSYKAKVLQYFQQLAIITPHADFSVSYEDGSDPKKNFSISFQRRSEKVPPLAKEVKHHPSSVNILVLKQLIDKSKQKSLLKFLTTELSSIDDGLARRIIAELGKDFTPSLRVGALNQHQIQALAHLLRQVEYKAPDFNHLSPAGEYNLQLGVLKELQPAIIATSSAPPAVFEGHSFIVEAAVSIGGSQVKEGLNIYRFANRIPLLFEQGGDVVTRTAMKRINWSAYKIDIKREKVGVFVSIVSTKIPFKGTGKEYIGDDIEEMRKSVKTVLQLCCQQLRTKLLERNALREHHERKRNLTRYIPDVTRACIGVLEVMRDRKSKERNESEESLEPKQRELLQAFEEKQITQSLLEKKLLDYVEQQHQKLTIEAPHIGNQAAESLFISPLRYDRCTAFHLRNADFVFRFFRSTAN